MLGPETYGYTLTYVDEILVRSPNIELHATHLNTILRKLNSAGFTVNTEKFNFCRTEVKFLGHILSSLFKDEAQTALFKDPVRTAQ